MLLDDFLALDYKGKMQATNGAVCISGRSDNQHMILLYQLNNFYIEVYYHKKYNYISDFHAFEDTDQLEPYLRKIEISLTY
jgi:hypothetical protein